MVLGTKEGALLWYREISKGERRTFWACFGGWALDAFDVQLFAVLIPTLIAVFGISKAEAGLLGGLTLAAAAAGGWAGGALADRFGRVWALQVTILFFSLATFASAFAQSYGQLLVVKGLQGLGFGAEWAVGVVLMSETIRPKHRGKALGAVQSAWAFGWAASVALYAVLFSLLPPEPGWRVLFGIGLVPAALILYVRAGIPEPLRKRAAATPFPETLTAIFAPPVWRVTLIGGLLGTGAHGGYYALMTWMPAYLNTERQLSAMRTGLYLGVIIIAFWCGCIAASFLLDTIGRRRTVLLFASGCVGMVLLYTMLPLSNGQMLLLGFPVADSPPPESRPAWERCSASSIRAAFAAPA